MSASILAQVNDNLEEEKQEAFRDELWMLVDKPYYSDSIRYKFDDTPAYTEDSD
jgi:hypothetical protein